MNLGFVIYNFTGVFIDMLFIYMLNFFVKLFGLFKRLMKIAVIKKLSPTFTIEEKELMEGLCNAMLSLLTKPYELHMIDFLIDSQNHFGMMPADFQNWEGGFC